MAKDELAARLAACSIGSCARHQDCMYHPCRSAYRASELVPAAALAEAVAECERSRAELIALRHWSVNHIDALLLYAAGSYPNDSHVKEAVAFCRIVAPGRKLRMDPLEGAAFHPAKAALTPTTDEARHASEGGDHG